MPLTSRSKITAELLGSLGWRPMFHREVDLLGERGEVFEVRVPDGTLNLTVLPARVVSGLIVTSDKAIRVCVGDVAQNQPVTLGAGGVFALLGSDVESEYACALSYTPGDGSVATCAVVCVVEEDAGGSMGFPAVIAAMGNQGGVTDDLLVAAAGRQGDPLPMTPAVWRSSETLTGEPWLPTLAEVGDGQATALVPTDFSETMSAAVRPASRPLASEIWRLGITAADASDLLFALPDGTTVVSMYDVGPFFLLGTDDGQVYRWTGSGAAEAVLSDSQGHAVQLGRPAGGGYVALMEAPSGLRWWESAIESYAQVGTWTLRAIDGLTGTRCSNLVQFRDAGMLATGTEAGDRVDVWEYSPVLGVSLLHSFTERTGQRPGPLWTIDNTTLDPSLCLGRLSLTATPLLELWGLRGISTTWALLMDFATGSGGSDTNTSITAIHYVQARGQLFVATGTPYAGPAPGARITIYPVP